MINYIYAFKNKKSGNFNKPMFDVISLEDADEAYTVTVKEAPKDQAERLKELSLYYLGKFDTKSGEFIETKCEFIFDCEVILNE